MKKLLNISVIAALAVLPLAANAAPEYASAIPAEPVTATANTKVATTSYVQGAYNAAIAVANKESQRASAAEGDLTTLTTTTKTSLVGAINEINTTAGNAANQALSNITTAGENVIKGLAADGAYDNTDSGLTATTLQDAIDEVATTAGGAANQALSNITTAGENVIKGLAADGAYDNTDSGLTATTIQDAIDEVAATAGNAADQDLSNLSATGTGVITSAVTSGAAGGTYSNTTSGLTATTIQGAIDEVAGSVATQGAKVLKVYTTWNTDTNQEITLTAPTQGS